MLSVLTTHHHHHQVCGRKLWKMMRISVALMVVMASLVFVNLSPNS